MCSAYSRSEKMNVLQLFPEYFIKKKILLGLEPYAYNLTIELDKLGVKSRVVTQRTDIESYNNIRTYTLPKIGRFTFLRTGIEAYKVIKSNHIAFDVLHQHNVGFFSIINYRKELNKPFVLTLHNSPSRLLRNIDYSNLKSVKEGLYFYFLSKLTVKCSDAVIVGSSECKSEIVKEFKTAEDKVHYIPAGYDDRVFKLSKTKKKNNLLFVGRFVKQKGITTLLKAFNEIVKLKPKLRLILIGANDKDNDYHNVIDTVKKYGLNRHVTILPPVQRKVLINYYHSSKLLIAPSTSEGTSQVGIEALACGTPVISTDVSGFKDYVINNSTGFRVGIGDYRKIADIVLKIVDDDSLLKKLGMRGNRLVKNNFTWRIIAQKHKRLYETLIRDFKSRNRGMEDKKPQMQ